MRYKTEKSAGFLVFKKDDKIKYLFLQSKGKYDIPKGLQQSGEDDLKTALRELEEETGLKVKVVPLFKKTTEYFYKWEGTLVRKVVVYFLGESESDEVKISPEHDGYLWMTKDEALTRIKYPSLKDLVKEAERFIIGIKVERI